MIDPVLEALTADRQIASNNCKCGHAREKHSKVMGCMHENYCNYGKLHYCDCENYEEII
jgi:hypothetical protein